MKFLQIIILMFTISSFSQKNEFDYPMYVTDSLGQKVVVMTIRQAMILDNNSDLLLILKKKSIEMDAYDDMCINVINDKNVVIYKMSVQISELEKLSEAKDKSIVLLQDKITLLLSQKKIYDEQLSNRADVIDNLNDKVRGLKTKMIIGGVGGGALIIGLVLLSIL